jgi:hypothetical protein
MPDLTLDSGGTHRWNGLDEEFEWYAFPDNPLINIRVSDQAFFGGEDRPGLIFQINNPSPAPPNNFGSMVLNLEYESGNKNTGFDIFMDNNLSPSYPTIIPPEEPYTIPGYVKVARKIDYFEGNTLSVSLDLTDVQDIISPPAAPYSGKIGIALVKTFGPVNTIQFSNATLKLARCLALI